jgi:radical SAM enzyme (TIGR01210 family)
VRESLASPYPTGMSERNAWIVSRRPSRNVVDPSRPYLYFVEDEYSSNGEVVPIATVFLTNRECPWRCVMCDLWKNTLTESVGLGAIPAQIQNALEHLSPARQIKLYNSGSFFDTGAIPPEDYGAIAQRVTSFERVIVECHPSLVGTRCLQFRDELSGRLEVAMGLETVHPEVLQKLNKRMTVDDFASAAHFLREHSIDLRVFILVKPPFMEESEAIDWAKRSLDFAFECGATAATLIPTRAGNGSMEVLTALGAFSAPRFETVEAAAEYGLSLNRGRVFVDLWELSAVKNCPDCLQERLVRLRRMNMEQKMVAPVACANCETGL